MTRASACSQRWGRLEEVINGIGGDEEGVLRRPGRRMCLGVAEDLKLTRTRRGR